MTAHPTAAVIRRATAADHAFLIDMLVEAANWHPERTTGRAELLASPAFAHYIDDWPRPTDAGVIAELTGTPAARDLASTERAGILAEPSARPAAAELGELGEPAGAELGGGMAGEIAAITVGAAWWRFLPAEDPGYGFVAVDVPEITLGVHPAYRRRGIGRQLLRALVGVAREAGLEWLSLSVERANYARGLYVQEGFTVVASDVDADTMVMSLR